MSSNPGFSFEVVAKDGTARRSVFTTSRARIETPVFMPVGTQASVKSQTPNEVEATGARIILANTYHLWLRPTAEIVDEMGGVQKFMRWPHAMLTDSGGFQVFSLSDLRKIDDDGVTFRSHLDGRKLRMTPEESMRVQSLLRSDVAMAFDECPPGGAEIGVIERAMKRTSEWAQRCLRVPLIDGQVRFGIVQGGTNVELRKRHLDVIANLEENGQRFFGIAQGGFSVGEPIEDMHRTLVEIVPGMPEDRPRYLMGVGTPYDLLRGIAAGIDLFDCVLPTRNARNGQALTWTGRVNMKQARHTRDEAPIDALCECPVCKTFSRGYIHHLIKAEEMLGARLVTEHNLHFYGALTKKAREAISEGRYASYAEDTILQMREGDEIGKTPSSPGRGKSETYKKHTERKQTQSVIGEKS